MALTPSTMSPLGEKAPDFSLPDSENRIFTRDQVKKSQGLLVMFICNHCPYVQHIATALASLGRDFANSNIGIVAINSNDTDKYPEDGPEAMAEEARMRGYTFPYLLDESQQIAKDYDAACTPDFFLYNYDLELVYRGQFDASRPGNGITVSGSDLRQAMSALLSNTPQAAQQMPSVGCNIKWRD